MALTKLIESNKTAKDLYLNISAKTREKLHVAFGVQDASFYKQSTVCINKLNERYYAR